MHLAQKLLAGNGVRIDAVRDEEHIAVVLVELRALVERAGVVDRQRVQPELLSELLQLLVGRILEVEPEELAPARGVRATSCGSALCRQIAG